MRKKMITMTSGLEKLCPYRKRFTAGTLVLLLLLWTPRVRAQSAPLFNIHVKSVSALQIFKLIQQQSTYRVLYLEKHLDPDQRVSMDLKSAGVNQVLDLALKNQPVSYTIEESTILIRPKTIQRSPSKTSPEGSSGPDTLEVSGRVTSDMNVPLPGATVKVEGSLLGVSTDAQGKFKLIYGSEFNGYLMISYVGFNSKRIKLPYLGNEGLEVQLQPSETALRSVEVVSTGYQVLPKERATGSFAQPDKKMFESRVSTDALSRLEGITPGVVFNRGDLGSGESTIKIRGQSTIYANDAPLVVVDGFPYEGNIYNINPNDIENITVLKDAAAKSIWGVRAGNGVIVISTKRGRYDQPMKISMNVNTTGIPKPDLKYDPAFLDAADFIDIEKTLFEKGYYQQRLDDPAFLVVSPVVELLERNRLGSLTESELDKSLNALKGIDVREGLKKYFYRTGLNQQYSLAFSGGSKTAGYYVSAGYDQNLGSQTGSDYSRIKFNSQNTFRPVERLEINLGIDYTQTLNHSDNVISQLYTGGGYQKLYPYAEFTNANGQPSTLPRDMRSDFIQAAPANGFLDWSYAPLLEKGKNTNEVKMVNTRVSGGIRYRLTKGLYAEFKGQVEKGNTGSVNLSSAESYYSRSLVNMFSIVDGGKAIGRNIPAGAIRVNGNQSGTTVNLRGQLNYERILDKHEFNGLAGIEQREEKTTGNTSNLYGYDVNTGNSATVNYTAYLPMYPSGGFGQISGNTAVSGMTNRFRSYFTNLSYSYDGRYTVSASGRIDGSNYFGVSTNKKMVPLWSSGVKWAVDREAFFHSGLLSSLSLRATYGFSGNMAANLAAVTTFRYEGTSYLTGAGVAAIANIPNPDLRWEKTGMANVGIDFAFRGNRISGSIEYFKKKGVDLIGDAIIDPTTGVSQLTGNFAGMKGQGLDLLVNAMVIQRPVQWRTSLNFSYVTDQISSYAMDVPAYQSVAGSITPVVGRPVYGMYSLRFAGLDPQTGDPLGYLGKDLSKDYGVLNSPSQQSDLVYSGPVRPVCYGGWTNTVSYKGLSLSMNLNFKLGYYFRRSTISYSSLYSSWQGHADFLDRWKAPGDEKKTSVPSMNYPGDPSRDYFYAQSQVTVEKGDHVRLQDISISYDFPHPPKAGQWFKGLQVYGYLNNVGILWSANKKGLDPDFPLGGFPMPRTLSAGIKAQF